MDKKGRGITLFCRKSFVSKCQKSSWGTLQCVRKFRVLKNFMDKISLFSIENFLSLPKNSWGSPSVFQKNSVVENFHAYEGASRFCRKFLSHWTETKNFVRELFCVSEDFWYGKKLMDTRGEVPRFSVEIFLSPVQKIFVG